MKKAFIIAIIAIMGIGTAFADFKDLGSTAEFEKVIQEAKVPVVVKFSAYWWGACQTLKKTMVNIAPSYSDEQVLLCTIDAYVNSDLKKYLMGGYPTVRVFNKGKAVKSSFVGNKNESFVRNFIDSVIVSPEAENVKLRELKTTNDLNELLKIARVPVIVKFSSPLWVGCNKLKTTMVKVAAGYSEQQVLLCSINPFDNPELQKYLIDGSIPTVRVFSQGKSIHSFVGNKDEAFVKEFFDKAANYKSPTTKKRQAFRQIDSAKELNEVIASSKVPVLVKFAAFFWSDCQELKKTMEKIAPDYSEQQVLLCTVDVVLNPSLLEYLDGRAPTIRVFSAGKMVKSYFQGNKDETFIRNFIDSIMLPKEK